MASLCRRCVAERFASDSGCWALLRPALKLLRLAGFAQFEQRLLSLSILTPQSQQTCFGVGNSIVGKLGWPFASLRCCCVKWVGMLRMDFDFDSLSQRVCATNSTHGAKSFLQVSAVLLSWAAKLDIRRTQPVAVSKKSDLRSGSWVTHRKTQLSSCGLTGSRTSSASESRLRMSVCRPTPNPGSRPCTVRSSRHSDS